MTRTKPNPQRIHGETIPSPSDTQSLRTRRDQQVLDEQRLGAPGGGGYIKHNAVLPGLTW
jgi:hypothetical protein